MHTQGEILSAHQLETIRLHRQSVHPVPVRWAVNEEWERPAMVNTKTYIYICVCVSSKVSHFFSFLAEQLKQYICWT